MKKGQTALEYLITYGWAILIILVVLAVLWYYGVFDPSKWAGEQLYCPSDFLLTDASLALGAGGAATLQVVLGNKVGDSLTLTGADVTLDGASLGTAVLTESLPAGEQTGPLTVTLAGLTGYSAGGIVNLKFVVDYTNTKTTLNGSEVCTLSIQAS